MRLSRVVATLAAIALVAALLATGSGCISATHFASDQAYSQTALGSIAVMRAYVEVMREGIGDKHTYQRIIADLEQDGFWARHTDENGGLVSRTEAGDIVPMPLVQAKAAFADLQTKYDAIYTSARAYQAQVDKLDRALSELESITQRKISGDLSDAEAMAQAMNVFSGLLGGGVSVGVTALAGVP